MCGRFTTISHEDVVRVVRAMQAEQARQEGTGASALAQREGSGDCTAPANPDDPASLTAPANASLTAPANPDDPASLTAPANPDDPASLTALEPREVRPSDVVPIIRLESEGFAIRMLTWGFPGFDKSGPLFNTRFERAFGNPGMWEQPFHEGRCIVCARAFFEPHATETVRSPKTGRPIKAQYRFETGKIMLMAGVSGADGRFSVVTTEPNAHVSPIHDRMPLLLDLPSALTWLMPGSAWREIAPSALPMSAAAEHPSLAATQQMSLF